MVIYRMVLRETLIDPQRLQNDGRSPDGTMPLPFLLHDDAEPLGAFLLWCLVIQRVEQERKRKMH
jgi:hypothetical protein